MSPEESIWWGSRLARLPNGTISPLINIGSSTESYRKNICPHIHSNIFQPLEERGVRIVHADLKKASGVDLVGDLTTQAMRDEIKRHNPKSLVCTNLLEHVHNRYLICDAIAEVLPPGGLALISVPKRYPYHPDPIDNGFRPNANQIAALFPAFELIEHGNVGFGNYFQQIQKKPWLLIRDAYLLVAGLVKRNRWRVFFSNYRYLIREYSVTCVVLRKRMISHEQ